MEQVLNVVLAAATKDAESTALTVKDKEDEIVEQLLSLELSAEDVGHSCATKDVLLRARHPP